MAKIETTAADRVTRSRQLSSLKRYLEYNFQDPVFITIMPNNDGLEKKPDSMFKALKRLGIDKYLLISDIGKNERLHYHGFIERELIDTNIFTYKGIKKSNHGNKNHIYDLSETSFQENFGYVNVSIPVSEEKRDLNISLSYVLKYTLKGQSVYFKHKIYKTHLLKVTPKAERIYKMTISQKENAKNEKYLIECFNYIKWLDNHIKNFLNENRLLSNEKKIEFLNEQIKNMDSMLFRIQRKATLTNKELKLNDMVMELGNKIDSLIDYYKAIKRNPKLKIEKEIDFWNSKK